MLEFSSMVLHAPSPYLQLVVLPKQLTTLFSSFLAPDILMKFGWGHPKNRASNTGGVGFVCSLYESRRRKSFAGP